MELFKTKTRTADQVITAKEAYPIVEAESASLPEELPEVQEPEAAVETSAKQNGKVKKKAAAAAFTAFASLSLVISSLFTSPEALLEEKAAWDPNGPVITQMAAEDDSEDADDEDEEEEGETEPDWKTALRAWFLRLPLVVRALFVLPLWAVGHGIAAGAAALWEPVLSPLLATALKWILIALILAGIVVACVKAVAPDTPIGKILNKKTVPVLLVIAGCLFVIDFSLPYIFEEYSKWRNIVCFVLGGMGLMAVLMWIGRKRQKKAETLPASV